MGDDFEEEDEEAGEEEPAAAAAAAQPAAASPAQVQAEAEARLPPEPAGSEGVRIGEGCLERCCLLFALRLDLEAEGRMPPEPAGSEGVRIGTGGGRECVCGPEAAGWSEGQGSEHAQAALCVRV